MGNDVAQWRTFIGRHALRMHRGESSGTGTEQKRCGCKHYPYRFPSEEPEDVQKALRQVCFDLFCFILY